MSSAPRCCHNARGGGGQASREAGAAKGSFTEEDVQVVTWESIPTCQVCTLQVQAGLRDPHGRQDGVGSRPGPAPLRWVIPYQSPALSERSPICTSKGPDWVAFSALTFFHARGGAGEDSRVRTRKPPARGDTLRQADARLGRPEELVFTVCT